MKKLLCYLGFCLFLWAGIYIGLIADVTDDKPYDQGGLALLAVLAFIIAILFMAKGNETPWKKDKE